MKPLTLPDPEGTPVIYACAHWRSFPPPFSSTLQSPEDLRKQGYLQESDYQRMLVWKRMCGLLVMDESKCMKCEHVRVAEIRKGLPVLTTMDGSLSVPAVDLPTMELNARRMGQPHLRRRPPPGIVGKVPGGAQGGS
jgi:hypothetical protein